MFSLIVRSICREGGMPKCISATKPVILGGTAWMSTKSSSNKLPWLMLSPAIDTGNSEMAFKFYSLAEKKVIITKGVKNQESNDDDVGLVGSSHGWLVLHNKGNHNLFLYNPVSCRRIELPSILTVPDKVIITRSPDDNDICLAMMCVKDTPAFCVPGRSTLWTDLNLNLDHKYKDFIYSTRHKFLFCETSLGKIESWDLTHPRFPRIVWQTSLEDNPDESNTNNVVRYLVFAEQSDELFLVKRHMNQQTTIGFDVFMIDDCGKLRHISTFNGLSFFVGGANNNTSFALPAAPELFPDSIYFTDDDNKHAIYNYRSGTISPCYNYPSDDAHSSTGWFSPCTEAVSKPPKNKITPWMLLQPVIREGNKMVYKFYSLAENKVKIVNNNKRGKVKVSSAESVVPVECEVGFLHFVGSSHGWLALQDMMELFLANPISSRRNHVKLPSIDYVTKLILSGSPHDDEQVCAMAIFNNPPDTSYGLAFCVPGRSTEWTRLVGPGPGPCAQTKTYKGYNDIVYSSRHKLFFCVDFAGRMESWDLTDTASPRIVWSAELKDMGLNNYSTIQSEQGLWPFTYKYLVFDDHSNQLFIVIQRVRHIGLIIHKSAGFDVYKIVDWEGGGRGRLRYMDGSLNGLSLFLGSNNGFALSAAEFPGLKPDSIYYSTTCHDIGIYNYQDATLSPCTYFHCDDKIFTTAPLWFTPPSLP